MIPPLRRVEALVFRYPVEVAVRTSFGLMHDRPAVFVRVEDSDDGVGWGEAWCNFPPPAAEHRARLVGEVLAPLILGRGFATPREAYAHLTDATAVLALQSGESGPLAQAIAGLDTALWDLAARRAGLPLWRLLGGTSPRIPVYASGINPTEPESVIRGMRERGHRAFKVKVGFGHDLDRRNVAAAREAAGDAAVLAVDANQAWDLAQASRILAGMRSFAPSWVEEPLRADRPWSEWRALAETTGLPLAAGENLAGEGAFAQALAAGVLSVVQPDLAKWGGLSGCEPVARSIVAAGRSYCPHYLGGGIGLLASAHLLAAVGGPGRLEIDVNVNPLRDELCGPLGVVEDGHVRLGEAPGLGIDVDLARFGAWRITRQELPSARA